MVLRLTEPSIQVADLCVGCVWKTLCLKLRVAMNPRHCSGRFSNPDPLRAGGSSSFGETLCCQPDVVLSFEGGKLPSCHGSLTLWLCRRCFLPAQVMATSRAQVTDLWTTLTNLNHVKADCCSLLKRKISGFNTVLHNWNRESCRKDKAGSAIKLKCVPKPTSVTHLSSQSSYQRPWLAAPLVKHS